MKIKKHNSLTSLVLIACFSSMILLLAGCGGGSSGDDSEPLRTSACDVLGLPNARIINGTPCSGRSPIVKIRLNEQNSASICTGTMITRNKVVTASHCVTFGTFQNVIRPGNVSISTGNINNPIARGKRIFNSSAAISDLRTIETEAIIRGELNQVENNAEVFFNYVEEFGLSDIAIIELDRSVDLPTMPIKISSSPSEGKVVSIFGFGITRGNTSSTPTQLFSGQMRVDSVGVKNIFAKFNGDGSNTCGGDSGGPLVEQLSDGTAVLVGSTLGGTNSDCSAGDRSSFTAMAGVGIEQFLKAAAPEAQYR